LGPAGIMPLWPMLFVTIACGAISGWHALFGAVGTARQIQNEADMLPIGGGSMFAEFLLGLLALLAVSVGAKGAPVGAFATGLGGANQMMAALSLLLVTVWLASVGKNWMYAGLPAAFMWVTTCASILVTAYNLYSNVYQINMAAGRTIPVVGSALMIVVALLLVVAALYIGLDTWRAFQRYRHRPVQQRKPAAARA